MSTSEVTHVIKRNGVREPISFDAIKDRLSKVAEGLNPKYIHPNKLTSQVCAGLAQDMQTRELDIHAAETAAALQTLHPDWGLLAARLIVSDLHKSTPADILEVIESLQTNVVEGQASPVLDPEYVEFVNKHYERIQKALDFDQDYKYDFFAIQTLIRQKYLLRSNDIIVERPQHMYMRVACALAMKRNDIDRAMKTYGLLSRRLYTHATPSLLNLGTLAGQGASCYLVPLKEDSISGMYDTVKNCAKISQGSGGIGVLLTPARSEGSYIKGSNGYSTGIFPYIRVLNETAKHVNQGGKRKGAFAAWLDIWHADLRVFLPMRMQNPNHDETAHDLHHGLMIPDLFWIRVKRDEMWSLFDPNEVKGLINAFGEKFNQMYEQFEKDGLAKEQIKAREVLKMINDIQGETGEPFMANKDQINWCSNQAHMGPILQSNLCVAGNTFVLTESGHCRIDSMVDHPVKVWNGQQWSDVIVQRTNTDQKLIRIYFDNGMSLDCTEYHKFYDQHGKELRANQLNEGTKLEKVKEWPIINGTEEFDYPYTQGLFCADGSYMKKIETHRCPHGSNDSGFCGNHQRHSGYRRTFDTEEEDTQCKAIVESIPILDLYGEKQELLQYLEVPSELVSIGTRNQEHNKTRITLPVTMEEKYKVPLNGTLSTKLKWLAGFCDGDGCIVRINDNKGIQVSSIEKQMLQNVKLMLQTLSVDVKIGLSRKQQTRDIKGKDYLVQDIWRICINHSDILRLNQLGFQCFRLKLDEMTTRQREAKRFVSVTKIEPVEGLHDTYCFNEPLCHRGIFNGVMTGQCVEITERTAPEIIDASGKVIEPEVIAVCTLASIPVNHYVKEDGTFDHEALIETVKIIVYNLDEMIEMNKYPLKEAEIPNKQDRPQGLGVQGLQNLFLKMNFPFESPEAKQLNRDIFETIAYGAHLASNELARKYGAYANWKGSPQSQGKFHFDLMYDAALERHRLYPKEFKEVPNKLFYQPRLHDWEPLRGKPMRNSLLLAPMPTATTASFSGLNGVVNVEAFEPLNSIAYTRRTLSGEFYCVVRELIDKLDELGLWSMNMKDRILAANGSIQHITEIPELIRKCHKTAFELPQKTLIDLAADRQVFICQSQSLNLFMLNPKEDKLRAMYMYSWQKGLKTNYYLRSTAPIDPKKFSIDSKKMNETEKMEEISHKLLALNREENSLSPESYSPIRNIAEIRNKKKTAVTKPSAEEIDLYAVCDPNDTSCAACSG